MKEWIIPVTWQMCGFVKVKSDTLEEAMEIAKDDDGVIPLPEHGEYVDGSWELSHTDVGEIRASYNKNQPDNITE